MKRGFTLKPHDCITVNIRRLCFELLKSTIITHIQVFHPKHWICLFWESGSTLNEFAFHLYLVLTDIFTHTGSQGDFCVEAESCELFCCCSFSPKWTWVCGCGPFKSRASNCRSPQSVRYPASQSGASAMQTVYYRHSFT